MFGLFAPPEVKESLLALDRQLADHDGKVNPVWGASSIVRTRVKEALNDQKLTVNSIRDDGLLPSTLVWLLISNVVDGELCCGRHHVYRGTLSGSGTELLSLWHRACRELTAAGYQTQSQGEADTLRLGKMIKEVG